jgi:three-Cys-motif partner protein
MGHVFGGRHSDEKVDVIRKYLTAYTTALKNKGFTLLYIDPFAGTGERTQREESMPLFEEDGDVVTMPGSASMALSIVPKFDVLVFIDAKAKHAKALEALKQQHPDRCIEIRRMDANHALQSIVREFQWRGPGVPGKGRRAVVFLDPYGMQVEWATLEAIKRTEAIDLWYLFPTHAVLRNAPRDGTKLDSHNEAALTRLFGTRERWQRILYPPKVLGADMFDEARVEQGKRTVTASDVEAAFREELVGLFTPGYVCEKPYRVIMRAKTGDYHAFSLFFAVANPDKKACEPAARIANAILNPKKRR